MQKKITPNHTRYTGQLFILLGSLTLAILFRQLYLRTRPLPLPPDLTADSPTSVSNNAKHQNFVLTLPALNKSLSIYPSIITKNGWQTTTKGVSYLSSSPLPGEQGNSVIYGHNWSNILGDLTKIKPGDKVIVTKDDNNQTFVVSYTATVDPNESSVYAPTTDTRLTIYTCTGLLDRQRFVVVAFPAT